MKISFNWLKEYLEIRETPEKVSTRLTDCGLEVENLEEFYPVEGGLEGVIIGEVLSCRKHPDADRLTICRVDIGDEDPVQIVCGAPNVAVGQKVPVATVGTMLYGSDKPFVIKASKIRGEESAGMICAEDELNLGESHDGIMVLDPSTPTGIPAAEYFNIRQDHVFEIGLTPNRPDAASHIGCARDLAAVYNAESGRKSSKMQPPSVDAFSIDDHSLEIRVRVDDPKLCPRYSGITLSKVKVGPSPKWMQDRLRACGLRPLNNVVDITNYVLLETGQPLHAFDAAKIRGAEVIIRTLPEGTTFRTLDEVDRKLSQHDLMICDTQGGMCIAGVFGGASAGVTAETTAIFLESAYFNPVSIRKTARRHGLNTDASFRFERGADPEITLYALKRASLLLREIAGASISSGIVDIYPEPIPRRQIELTQENLDRLTGISIDGELVETILEDLGFSILGTKPGGWQLEVPANKVDVTRPADVIEEVLRIYGYNRVPMPEKISFSPDIQSYGDEESLRNLISDHLSARGFHETMNNSLTNAAYSKIIPGIDSRKQVKMLNALSSELDVMRQSLVPGGLETIRYNLNRQSPDLRFYEFGTIYHDLGKDHPDQRFSEQRLLTLFLTGRARPENWKEKPRDVDAFDIGHEVMRLLERVGIKTDSMTPSDGGLFTSGIEMHETDRVIARYGEIDKKVITAFDIGQPVFMAEIDWEYFEQLSSKTITSFRAVPRFPEVRRDLALVVTNSVSYADIRKVAFETERKILFSMNLFDVFEGEKVGQGKKSYAISFTLRDTEKTLADKAIDKTMKRLIEAFREKIGAELR